MEKVHESKFEFKFGSKFLCVKILNELEKQRWHLASTYIIASKAFCNIGSPSGLLCLDTLCNTTRVELSRSLNDIWSWGALTTS